MSGKIKSLKKVGIFVICLLLIVVTSFLIKYKYYKGSNRENEQDRTVEINKEKELKSTIKDKELDKKVEEEKEDKKESVTEKKKEQTNDASKTNNNNNNSTNNSNSNIDKNNNYQKNETKANTNSKTNSTQKTVEQQNITNKTENDNENKSSQNTDKSNELYYSITKGRKEYSIQSECYSAGLSIQNKELDSVLDWNEANPNDQKQPIIKSSMCIGVMENGKEYYYLHFVTTTGNNLDEELKQKYK